MKQKVTFPVLISGITSKADKSVKITIETREFAPDESAILFSLRGQEAFCLFASEEIQEDDVLDLEDREVEPQRSVSPSKKLRNHLYRLWEKTGRGDFQGYYENKIDQWCATIREKLDE